jgi:hypothetical protein
VTRGGELVVSLFGDLGCLIWFGISCLLVCFGAFFFVWFGFICSFIRLTWLSLLQFMLAFFSLPAQLCGSAASILPRVELCHGPLPEARLCPGDRLVQARALFHSAAGRREQGALHVPHVLAALSLLCVSSLLFPLTVYFFLPHVFAVLSLFVPFFLSDLFFILLTD